MFSLLFSLSILEWMGGNAFFGHSLDTKVNLNYKNVLDSCFKMNPGFCFDADIVSPRDHQMLVMEEMVCDTGRVSS